MSEKEHKVRCHLSYMKGGKTREQMINLMDKDESLFKYALRKKLIKAVHQYSYYYLYFKNYYA